MSLSNQAMLVNLLIRKWDARKLDRSASREIAAKHSAGDAGNFNKLLIDKSALDPINKATSALRNEHYDMTLAWGDNGDRLLPSKLYMKYVDHMRKRRAEIDRLFDGFVQAYPGLVVAARKRLGTLYEPGDYPPANDVRKRFGIEMAFTPVPDANDFRVDVAAEDAVQLKADITRMVEERQRAVVAEVHERAKEMVTRVHERLTSEKPIIRETLMTNLVDLVDLLHAFNRSNDPELTQLETDLRALIRNPDSLRNSAVVRKTTAEAANDIMVRMKWAA